MNSANRRAAQAAVASAWLFAAAASAQPAAAGAAADEPMRFERFHRSYVLAADGSDTATTGLIVRAKSTQAVEGLRQYQLSHSTSAQQLEVLEARTLKADGRAIPVPPGNFQVATQGGSEGRSAPISDFRTTTVLFPELAVGDAIAIRFRMKTIEPLFPGRVSLHDVFSRDAPFDDVFVTVDAPIGLAARFEGPGLRQEVKEAGGRRVVEWRLEQRTPRRPPRQDFGAWRPDSEPSYFYSTFTSHADIAQQYAMRAAPKAVPTPRTRELAATIVGSATAPREQAKRLYEWVATQITYLGNCVGIGAVVPREQAFVLDNKLGDCKDKATLLQALLAARGIESHPVLVNASNIWELTKVPVLALVNHVIVYIPSLSLFADPTDDGMPFGWLPRVVAGKPALAAAPGVPARTPMPPEVESQQMTMRAAIGAEGGITGEVEVVLAGYGAIDMRRGLRSATRDRIDEWAKGAFRGRGQDPRVELDHEDPKPLAATFRYRARIDVKGMLRWPGAGAFAIGPLFHSAHPIAGVAQNSLGPWPDHEIVCGSVKTSERHELTLPDGMNVLSLPQGTAFSAPLVTYESRYTLEGRVLRAERTLDDRMGGPVCTPEVGRAFGVQMAPVVKDLQQQVLHR
jgi:transglutaminase-like putative cysteine protease